MPDTTLTLTLTDIANGGQALGRHKDKVIFVPYAIPGEEVVVRVVEDKGRFAFAEGVRVLAISEDRVKPVCVHFGPKRCANCQWQHIDYPAQVALKTDIVSDQFARVGGFDDAPIQMAIPSPQEWGYLHQATLYPVEEGRLGYPAIHNRRLIIPLEECHIITPALWQGIQQLDLSANSLTRVKIMDNGAGALMLILSTEDDEAPELELDLPGLSVNLLMSDNTPANLIGATHLNYRLFGQNFRVTAGSYLRGNPAQIERLAEVVRGFVPMTGAENVLDLYCGVGIFAAAFAPDANLVTCVDSYPPAMTDAEENLAVFEHVNVIEGGVADILDSIPDDEVYSVAIIDPPPSGMDKDTLDAFGQIQPAHVVILNDDPATLARDVRELVKRYRYRLEAVQPIDFEPQTFHIVTVAYLRKGNA